jgi:hypothetical protein
MTPEQHRHIFQARGIALVNAFGLDPDNVREDGVTIHNGTSVTFRTVDDEHHFGGDDLTDAQREAIAAYWAPITAEELA